MIILKVKLYFTLEHTTESQTESIGIALSVTSNLGVGGWSATRLVRFTRGERLTTHCVGGWVGPRASLDDCGK